MIEARTVAFILIILLIAFIVYRLCLSNERKTKGGFDNLNNAVLAVYDSIEKGTKYKDIDIIAATYEVLETLSLKLEEPNKTLKSEFYDKLNDNEKLAFIEALIHSLYVEGYVPSEFIGLDLGKKQVILKAKHNYKYSDITICLNNSSNEISDMSKYLNTINDSANNYKISICNSIKAKSVSRWCRWGVYEYKENDNRRIDIGYNELDFDLPDISTVRPEETINLFSYDSNSFNEDENGINTHDITANSGILTRGQPGNIDDSIKQNNFIPITDNNGPRVDESNDNANSLDKKNNQNLNIMPTTELTNNETNLVNNDDSNRADESNDKHNNLNNGVGDNMAKLLALANAMNEKNNKNLLTMANMGIDN